MTTHKTKLLPSSKVVRKVDNNKKKEKKDLLNLKIDKNMKFYEKTG